MNQRPVSPVTPGLFLLVLHENLGARAQALRETIPKPVEDDLSAEIDELVGALRNDVRLVTSALDTPGADEQIFSAIAATLGTTQAEQLYDLAAIEALPAAAIVAATLLAMVACFAPLVILASFVLRRSWVAQRNATVMPFGAPEKDYTVFSD